VPGPARQLAAVFAGGCLGALARAEVGELLPHASGAWPWATFAVNVAGACLLGAVLGRAERSPFLGAGFCGALTTFSALQLELLEMLDAGRAGPALAYAAASVACGLAAVMAGRRAVGA
jgi:CrcB protein